MQKRTSSNAARKAWNILRLALLWARKGGVLMHKKKLMMHLPKFIKTLRHAETGGRRGSHLYYGDRQLSFDDTPVIHVKMHRPNSMRFKLPCINPQVLDFDYDFGEDDTNDDDARKSFLTNGDDHYDHEDHDDIPPEVCDQEKGIDMKAEEFIAKFYEQLKLQRQISYIQYK